ncbi:PREDICTED: testis-expressed sequence 40 protein isoform X2 [Myotis brandtii]|uniref:testis-expressed sequence 40 protein isoform X2 n=1 Tax=Myotis brandtii TaxID=109478 RepID=UPI0003BB7579|nr:PREDICTED: testis-expressed sequence 40 protein isoform X2 [Myotis brandtii]
MLWLMALAKNDSVKLSSKSDIRNLWTKATLSQPKLNGLTNVYEDSDQEDSSSRSKSGQWYRRKTDPGRASGKWDDRNKGSITQGELDGHTLEQSPNSFQRNHVEGVQDSGELDSSVSSLNIMKHTHHRAYWEEQQDRLPLPLMDLMENEALEILTKALQGGMSLCAASAPSLIDVKSLWTVDGLGKPPLVCPVYGMRGRDWLMANGECSRRCPKSCRCPRSGRQHFLYSCSHSSSTSISSPAPHPPPIWSTGLATKPPGPSASEIQSSPN